MLRPVGIALLVPSRARRASAARARASTLPRSAICVVKGIPSLANAASLPASGARMSVKPACWFSVMSRPSALILSIVARGRRPVRTIEDVTLAGLAASVKSIVTAARDAAPLTRQPVSSSFWPASTQVCETSLAPKARDALRLRCERASARKRSQSPLAAFRRAVRKPGHRGRVRGGRRRALPARGRRVGGGQRALDRRKVDGGAGRGRGGEEDGQRERRAGASEGSTCCRQRTAAPKLARWR